MLRKLFALALLGALPLLLSCKKSQKETYTGPPGYMHLEAKVTLKTTSLTLVGLIKTHGLDECNAQQAEVKADVIGGLLDECEECLKSYTSECLEEPPYFYAATFDNKPIHQTYLSTKEVPETKLRDERFVIFGVPKAVATKVCQEMCQTYRTKNTGIDVSCHCIESSK
ncbi:MAG: hypothetical protein H6718_09785 [Polyangiaceae bacterium]|nr:hypothetical protein [Myxococcales bacterium]MCB9585679.1 hypothetical protein [Polyangiaceae bacterium]MCB9607392.1 hypothetical protein [Polyangiaceae bacterium]